MKKYSRFVIVDYLVPDDFSYVRFYSIVYAEIRAGLLVAMWSRLA